MAGTSLSCRVPKTWPKTFDPKPVFKNKSIGSKACLDMSDFLSPWSGPHFPVVCPMFVRTDLPPQPFLKNRTPAPELGWTCEHLLAHGRDLTFVPKTWPKTCVPTPVFKKKKLVPKLAWTCQIFLGHGQDLTSPSCVQGLCEQICHHNHF
jgi:hypothetical protein